MTRTPWAALALLLVGPAVSALSVQLAQSAQTAEGAATLVTGGVIVRQAVGTGATPATIRDGETRSVHKGDIMPLTYLEVRFDVKGR